MNHAIQALEIALDTYRTNEPISRSEERIEDSARELTAAAEIEMAIEILRVSAHASGLPFTIALHAAKLGRRIARSGWNGKGMWVAVGNGQADLPAEKFWNPHTRAFAESNGGKADVLPYMIMKTADGRILMGWLASQSDMLAEDWEILPDENSPSASGSDAPTESEKSGG